MLKKWKEFFKNYDFSFFLVFVAIFVVASLNLYSITFNQSNAYLVKQQWIWFALASGVGFAISFVQPSAFRRFSYWIYGINVALLLGVLVLGAVGMGAKRWIALGGLRIQPSEFMKLSIVFALARWFTINSPVERLDLKGLFFPFLLSVIPAILIIKQPDLGTGGVILLIFTMIIYYRKLRWSTILKLSVMGVISGFLMYSYVLKDYQKKRIHSFIDPYQDAKNSGYNAIQSNIAIGSGKIWGKGYMKSSQASLNFLPEKHTDFVFSIFAEEHGFVGVVLLLILYFLFIFRLLWLSQMVTTIFDSIFCIGLLSVLFLHVLINIAMVSGLLPIVGLPLPLMTYGGSSMLVFGILTGLATSISNARLLF